MNAMFAQFCLSAESVSSIAARYAMKTATALDVEVRSIGNGRLCAATGSTQAIARLIGAVADEGEDALYKAEIICR